MIKQLLRNKVYTDPLKYIERMIKRNKKLERRLSFIFTSFNIVSILGAFTIVLITIIIASGLIWSSHDSHSNWYLFFTIGFSAGTSFITSLLNFFVVKDHLQAIRIQKNEIAAEIIFYVNYQGIYVGTKNQRDYRLFLQISAIMGSEAAKKEAKFE